jgi:hypothetical protein
MPAGTRLERVGPADLDRVVDVEHPEIAECELVELLEARALGDQLSNVDLAREIQVDHAQLSRVRRGLERLGVDACARIVARYPEMATAAARYLAQRYSPGALRLLEQASRLARDDDDDDEVA